MFLVDAQLPSLLAEWIRAKGYLAIHVNDLPNQDETEDEEIRNIADEADYIVITKDSDFYDSHIIKNSPRKLLLITTGNIKNRQFLDLFRKNFQTLIDLFDACNFIEMSNTDLIVHE